MIRMQRVYGGGKPESGYRILVDRIWPRGLRKEDVRADLWLKEVAPSNELRKWYGHDPARWEEFKKRYFRELAGQEDGVRLIEERAGAGDVVLLFGSREEKLNNAAALKEYVESRMGR